MKEVSYTGIYIPKNERKKFKKKFFEFENKYFSHEDYLKFCSLYNLFQIENSIEYFHHSTICLGTIDSNLTTHNIKIHRKEKISILGIGFLFIENKPMVISLKIKSKVWSKNEVKHITLFVRKDNEGKPHQSNLLKETDYIPFNKSIDIYGYIKEFDKNGLINL